MEIGRETGREGGKVWTHLCQHKRAGEWAIAENPDNAVSTKRALNGLC